MIKTIQIVVDTSGSMNEMGKIQLQRNLCRYIAHQRLIEQEKYSDLCLCFFQWAQSISEITIQSDGDISALTAKSSSNLYALSDYLSQHLKDTKKARVLILSDGNFTNSNIVSFQSQLGTFSDLSIRTVAVGADADLLKLKKISTNNSVYLSENISSAIDSIIFGSDESFDAPVSTEQILHSATANTEELEEN